MAEWREATGLLPAGGGPACGELAVHLDGWEFPLMQMLRLLAAREVHALPSAAGQLVNIGAAPRWAREDEAAALRLFINAVKLSNSPPDGGHHQQEATATKWEVKTGWGDSKNDETIPEDAGVAFAVELVGYEAWLLTTKVSEAERLLQRGVLGQ